MQGWKMLKHIMLLLCTPYGLYQRPNKRYVSRNLKKFKAQCRKFHQSNKHLILTLGLIQGGPKK